MRSGDSCVFSDALPKAESITWPLVLPSHLVHISIMSLNTKSLSERHVFAYDVSSTFPTCKHLLILQNPMNIDCMDE